MTLVFENNGWAAAAIICASLFIFLVFVSEAIYQADTWDYSFSDTLGRPSFWVGSGIAFVLLYAAANGIVWWVSSSSQEDRPAQLSDAMGAYGITSGEAYPLFLGGTANSLEGTAQATSTIFSSSAVIDLKPTTVVNVGFQHGELWWPVALPADRSPFKETSGTPSITLWLYNSQLQGNEAYWERTYGACSLVVQSFWFTCEKALESEELVISDAWLHQSVPDFISTYFDHAEIALTPEQHDVLFPKN